MFRTTTSPRFQLFSLFLFLFLLLGTGTPAESGKRSDLYSFDSARMSMLSITAVEAKHHVNILASDEFQGRGAGTAGQWLAAKYIATEFVNYGLEPAGDDKRYYQDFEIVHRDLGTTRFVIERGTQQVDFPLKRAYVPFSFTGENDLKANIVFVGYGITAPEYGYDDYRDIDVHGKFVLMFRHEPRENDATSVFDGSRLTEHATFEAKARNAHRHGAVGMLLVTDPNGHENLTPQGYWPSFFRRADNKGKWQLGTNPDLPDFPAIWISGKAAEEMVKDSGYTLGDLQRRIDRSMQPASFEIPNVRIGVTVKLKVESRETQNVLGFLEGADPDLRDEVVVVGAHYDHLGIINGLIHNGADDNASGTAGVLEIAEAFTELPLPPRRSVLFITFSAEELGLLGSEFYVAHPAIPLAKTVAMINLDMISRNEEDRVTVIGSNRSRVLHELNIAANDEIRLDLRYDGERYFDRSDQANFAKHRIPVLFYNTDVHPDYHRPSDDSYKINPNKLARIARLAFLVAWKIADSSFRPSYDLGR